MGDAITESIETVGCDENCDVNVDSDVVILTRYVPDGGWGWVVVFSAFVFNLISDGCCYSFGVLYIQLLEYFGDSKSDTSWIGSLFFSVPLLFGPVASVLCTRFGCRKITIAGGIIAAIGFISSAFANSVTTLYVTFGIIAGFGISLPYLASVLIISKHFRKKLALATGIAECGAGIGTIVFAPLIESLISCYGWRGAMLILSGIISNIVICGALFRPVAVWKSKTVELEIQNSLLMTSAEEVLGRPEPGENQNVEDSLNKVNEQTETQNYRMVTISEGAFNKSQQEDIQSANDNVYNENDKTEVRTSLLVTVCKEDFDKPEQEDGVNGNNNTFKETGVTTQNNSHCDNSKVTKLGRFQDGNIPHSLPSEQKHKKCCQNCTTNLTLSIFKNPIFVMFLLSNFILYFFYDVPFIFMVDRAVELNISKPKAALIVSVIGVLHTIGNLIYGCVGDYRKISNPVLFGTSIGICGVAMTLVPLCMDFIPMSILGGVFGFLSASGEALGSILLVEIFGEENLCKSYGYTMFLKGIANLLGPPFAGWLFDISGSYDNTFYTTGGCLVFSGALYAFGPIIHKYLTRNVKSNTLKPSI